MRKLPLSKLEIRSLRHPKETTYFLLAVSSYLVFMTVAVILVQYIDLLLAGSILIGWVLLSLSGNYLGKSWLIRKSIRIAKESYPEFHGLHLQVEDWLNMRSGTPAYLVPESRNKRWLLQLINPNIILIDANILEVPQRDIRQVMMQWHIASQLGQKKVEQLRWGIAYYFYRPLLLTKLLNFPLLAYRRRTQLSGDNVAVMLVQHLEHTTSALPQSLCSAQAHMQIQAGLELDPRLRRILSNTLTLRFDGRSTLLRRFLNLLAFYQTHFPKAYSHYMEMIQLRPRGQFTPQFPDSYQHRPLVQLQKISGNTTNSRPNLRSHIEISTK